MTVLTAMLLAACSDSGDQADRPAPTSTAASATSAPPSASALPTGGSSDTAGSSRGRALTVDGLSFDLPGCYTSLDPAELALPGQQQCRHPDDGRPARRHAGQADQAVLPGRSLRRQRQGAHQGFTDNVNVVVAGSSLPDEDQVRLQFAQTGGHVTGIRHATSPAGRVVDVDFTISLQSGVPVHARGIFAETGGQVVDVTISSATTDEAQRVGDQVLASLDQANT